MQRDWKLYLSFLSKDHNLIGLYMAANIFWVPHHSSSGAFLHKVAEEKGEGSMVPPSIMRSVKTSLFLTEDTVSARDSVHNLEVHFASQIPGLYANIAFNFHSSPSMLKEKFAPKNFLLKSGNIRDVPLFGCGTHILMFTGSLHDLHGYVKIAHHLRLSAAGSASWTTFWQPDFTQDWRRTELALHHERESSTLKNVRKFTLTSVTLFWNRENQLRLTKDPMIPIKEKKISK